MSNHITPIHEDKLTVENEEFDEVTLGDSTEFVQFAINKKPIDFSAAVQSSLFNRVRERIDDFRQEVGPEYFNKQNNE